jgi:hypothetical protein
MHLEQSITDLAPNLETKIESFEKYEDALDYCKDRKTVGLIFLLEDQSTPTIGDIFRNLGKSYSTSGWPAFGTLIYKECKTITGQSLLVQNRNILSYFGADEFKNAERCQSILADLWTGVVSRVEEQLLPPALQDTLVAIAESNSPSGSLLFQDRLLNLFSANLALSWKDVFALKWGTVIQRVNQVSPLVMSPHKAICSLTEAIFSIGSNAKFSVNMVTDNTISLPRRVHTLIEHLDTERSNGRLEAALDSLGRLSKPGAPALIRHLSKYRSQISSFDQQKITA